VADLGASTLSLHAPPAAPVVHSSAGGGCRSFVVAGDGVYVLNELHCTVSALSLPGLSLLSTVSLLAPGEAPSRGHHLGGGGILLAGGRLYCTTRQTSPGKVHVLSVDPLEKVSEVGSGGDIPRHLSASADGRVLFVANQGRGGGGAVAAFEIGEGGKLTEKGRAEVPASVTFVHEY
jgi:6-phosphogluconolactonase (cycloisomerase 2 family)